MINLMKISKKKILNSEMRLNDIKNIKEWKEFD
jgi:hypothetical protein